MAWMKVGLVATAPSFNARSLWLMYTFSFATAQDGRQNSSKNMGDRKLRAQQQGNTSGRLRLHTSSNRKKAVTAAAHQDT